MDQVDWFAFDVVWEYHQKICPYVLRFYPNQHSVEMFDVMKRKNFLSRSRADNLHISQLYIGNTVSVLGRQLMVTGYANDKTAALMKTYFERAIVIFKLNEHFGRVMEAICGSSTNSPLRITRVRMTTLDYDDMKPLGLTGQCHYRGPSIVLEVVGGNAVQKCCQVLDAIREGYALQEFSYAASDICSAEAALCMMFSMKPRFNNPYCGEGILCLIKPHAVREGSAPQIISEILNNGFRILTIDTLVIARELAEGFLELYKGVVPEYLPWVDELVSGNTIALELDFCDGDAYEAFRDFAGPFDPVLAKTIRPSTLRARFGQDKVHNAIHCTDLKRDCQADLDFVFRYAARPEPP